ncbi:hypothetical protein HPB52_015896 [Rhipicephalus sanguineus]|uniref:SCP domain-containing protein n=1 Tax=Rhipicephalus sanguineus TaxID=34632 RepID=A0A9D4PMT8_RHISA|nr:hypothetical protein HPB52_015896 [Rhipicephalus sanguineus]
MAVVAWILAASLVVISSLPDLTESFSRYEIPHNLRNIRQQVLRRHNYYRRKHGVPPLKMSRKLNEHCQRRAVRLAKLDRLDHGGAKYAESIAAFPKEGNNGSLGRSVVDSWYSEIEQYDFSNGYYSKDTGHFTQIIWKKTRMVGTGSAVSPKSDRIFVASCYDPPQDNGGTYEENVPRPRVGRYSSRHDC